MAEEVFELTNVKQFNQFIKEGLVLVDFYADWCMHCITMFPIVEELAEKFKGKIKFTKVDIDGDQALSKKYNINTLPTFILFKDGEIKEKIIGTFYTEPFVEVLKKHIS
ncbi:thioredoxin [Patescibacteria group bacterium]|nr:thioredoxin [Patescibacteria group bacterium]